MKKFYSIIAALFTALTISAQSDVCFVDAAGNAIADGTVVTMDEVEVDDFDDTMVPLKGLFIQNNTEDEVTLRLLVSTEEFAGMYFACCVGTNCRNLSNAGTMTVDKIVLGANEKVEITNTEWVVNPGEYGTLATKFALEESNGLGYEAQTEIGINFVYADQSNVESVNGSDAKVVKTFDLQGRETTAQKGLLIEKLSDGSVRKVMK